MDFGVLILPDFPETKKSENNFQLYILIFSHLLG
jgi:hypothetical protein